MTPASMMLPLYSFSFTSPVTVCWVLVTKADRASRRGVNPLAEVDQISKLEADLLLVVVGVAVEADFFQLVVSVVEDGAARSLIHAAALHADQTVFHHVHDADTVSAAQLVELLDEFHSAQLFAVDSGGNALLKVDGHVFRLGREPARERNAQLQEVGVVILRLVGRVFQIEALVGEVPQVFILGIVVSRVIFSGML